MKITEPSVKDLDWVERLEDGRSTNRTLICIVGKKRIAIRVMGRLGDEDLVDGVCGLLKLENK